MNYTHPPTRPDVTHRHNGPRPSETRADLFQPPLHPADDHGDDTGFAVVDRLARPSWAEVEDARGRHDRAAKRLRRWQLWFVGMFTLYATLTGILLLSLILRG